MNRKGIALPMALVAVLLMTALSTAALNTARLRMLTGARTLAARRALEAANGAVARHAAKWDSTAGTAPLGQTVGWPSAYNSPSLATSDSLTRLGRHLFLVRVTATAKSMGGTELARDRVSRVVRLIPPELLSDSAHRVALDAWVLRSSRDNVAMMPGVMFVANGWWRWP